MKAAAPRFDWPALRTAAVLGLSVGWGGCLAYEVASAPVKVAATTAGVATDVAVGSAKAAGSVAVGAVGLAAKVARNGMVTFVDATGNRVARVPWRTGLTLASAGATAKVSLTQRNVAVVRAGRVVYSAAADAARTLVLVSGDVVRVAN